MPTINMIASKRAERKRLERIVRILSMAVVLVVLLAASLCTSLGIKIMMLNGEHATVESDLAQIQPAVDRIHDIKSAQSKLQPKVTLLSQAKVSTMRWKDLMMDLSASMPDKTWLTGFRVDKDDKGKVASVNLTGTSTRQALVGETMLRVGNHKSVKDVKLKYTNSGKVGEEPIVNFELAANVPNPNTEGKPK